MEDELLDGFNYTVFTFIIKYSNNRSEESVRASNDLERGDYLKLDCSGGTNFINVLTEDDISVGYVDEEYVNLFNTYAEQLDFSVVRKVLGTKKRNIYVEVYFKGEIMDVGFEREFASGYLEELGKTYENAFGSKSKYPDIAVEAFLSVAKKKRKAPNKITCYHQACMCYRQMEEYENELQMIHYVLNEFKNDIDNNSKELFERRLDKVIALIEKPKKE